ncbi:MAG: hypothetical protein JSS76_08315 [Bacteroidetes bacterium]|nr:hypothetical protein [Bacteroidota bacterium]
MKNQTTKEKVLAAILSFRGIGLQLLDIDLNKFYGFGFSLLTFARHKRGTMCNEYSAVALLFFKVRMNYDRGGRALQLRGGVLWLRGLLFTWVLEAELPECGYCGGQCYDRKYTAYDKHFCDQACIESYKYQHCID